MLLQRTGSCNNLSSKESKRCVLAQTARCFSRFNFPFNVKKKISTAQQGPGPGGVVGVAVGAQGGPGQAAGSGAGLSGGGGGAGTSGQGAGGPVHGFVSGAAGGTHQSE